MALLTYPLLLWLPRAPHTACADMSAAAKANPWTGRPRFGLPQPSADALRLFCFTPAGSGPTTYTQNGWAELPPSIEVMPVLLPGRAQRIGEPALRSVEEMASGAFAALRPMLAERPYALFGHSLGASVALEFARLVAAEAAAGLPQPKHFIASARLPAGSPTAGPRLTAIADDRAFITAIHGKYGTLQMVLDSPELMEMVLPMMRADFGAAEVRCRQRHALDALRHSSNKSHALKNICFNCSP